MMRLSSALLIAEVSAVVVICLSGAGKALKINKRQRGFVTSIEGLQSESLFELYPNGQRNPMHKPAALVLLLACLSSVIGQATTAKTNQFTELVKTTQENARAKSAADYIDKNHDSILQEWGAITEINAPSRQEKERAGYIESLLKNYKLQEVRYDAAGNLIAVRKGSGGGPTVVFDAHLDTVFQPGLKIKTTIKDGRIYGPGVGDDTRNIEALLATMRALDSANIQTKGDLIFVFTTDEETGLTGAKFFTKENKGKVNYYIALDGGYEGFTYAGIGINWYRHHFIGPGGHTRSRTPPYSATLPLARAIDRLYQLKVPTNPSSNLNIGMLGGSEVVNAKAADAWFSVDLRSTSNEVIADLEKQIGAILKEEADRAGMTVKTEVISTSPAANRQRRLQQLQRSVARRHSFNLNGRWPMQ
jgi:acetylornithine deacetylase/succinyl-diaminopimelate desuccinylase-like protein